MGFLKGTCHGGPLDGQERVSRFPAGFLAADKPAGRAWLYDWNPERGCFDVREPEGRELDGDRAIEAAVGDEYDVVAVSTGDDDGGA